MIYDLLFPKLGCNGLNGDLEASNFLTIWVYGSMFCLHPHPPPYTRILVLDTLNENYHADK